MAGTKAGGLRAAATNKARHGSNFYSKIGAKGGKNGNTGGFASRIPCFCPQISESHHKAQCAGMRGGRMSTRQGVPNRPKNRTA